MKYLLALLLLATSWSSFASCNGYYLDQFSTNGNVASDSGYQRNNGNRNFSSGWQEYDPDQYLDWFTWRPYNYVRIESGSAKMTRRTLGGSPEFWRFANLSNTNYARFSFNYSGGDSNDTFEVWHTRNNGSSWSKITDIVGSGGSYSYVIPESYRVSNYGVRFRITPTGFLGLGFNYIGQWLNIDNFRIDTECVDHFRIDAGNSASTCSPEAVTVRACADSNCNSLMSNYNGTINLSTTTGNGDWSKVSANGSLSAGSNDSGNASYTFSTSDNGTVQLGLSNQHAETLRVNVSGDNSAQSSDVSFSDLVFNFTNDSDSVAGMPKTMGVELLRRDPSTGTCGLASDYNGNKAMKFWIEKSTRDTGVIFPSAGAATLLTSEPASTNLTLNFTSGASNFSLGTSDIGEFKIWVKEQTGFAKASNGSAAAITGSSAQFIKYPFALSVDLEGQRSRDLQANDPTVGANGFKFKSAGETFQLNLKGLLWDAADDTNNDGIPDAGAWLFNNSFVPGYGNEPSSPFVVLSVTGSEPSAGETGTLTYNTNLHPFNSGLDMDISYSEIGTFDLEASHSYLGHTITGTALDIGNFSAGYFEVSANTPTLRNGDSSWACSFTYQGRPFEFSVQPELTVTVRGEGGGLLKNYVGSYFNLPLTQDPIATDMHAGSSTISAVHDGAYVVSEQNDYDGQFKITRVSSAGNRDQFTYDKAAITPDNTDIPFNALMAWEVPAAALTDSYGTCYRNGTASCQDYQITNITGANIRYGRALLTDASGVATNSLLVPFEAQQYQQIGSNYDFVTNADDSCTAISTVQSSNTLFGNFTLSDFSDELTAGETAVSFSSVALNNGEGDVILSAPGDANAGRVRVSTTGLDHFMFDFDSGSAGAENTSALATFGQPANVSPILFRTESYRN